MIADLERRLWLAEIRSQHLEQSAEAARKTGANNLQWLAQLWTMEKIATAPTCTATYSGTVDGCSGALAGATITVKNGGGSVLDTQTSDGSGNYSGSATITSPMESVNVEISATGYSTTTLSETFSCGANPLGTTTLSPSPGCCATFSGTVLNCNSTGNAGATIVATVGLSTLWTGTSDSFGNFSGGLLLSSGTSTSVTFTVTATSARFATFTQAVTLNCGANTLPNFSLTAASSYVCTTLCPLPIAKTLFLTDPVIGVATINWVSGSIWQGSITGYSYPGCSDPGGGGCSPISCPATTLDVTYIFVAPFTSAGDMEIDYSAHPSGCPGLGAPASTHKLFPAYQTSTCPTSFSITYKFNPTCKDPLYCSNNVTYTLTE